MTIRKVLSLCLALALTLGFAGALAEEDLQAQLDAANERIEELEAQVELYYPYYQKQIVATYGTDGIIWLEDVQAEYDAVNAQYQSYGLSLEAYGMVDSVKMDIVNTAVENAVLLDKAAELGLDQFDEATEADFDTRADAEIEQYISYYIDYFYADAEEVTDEMRAEAEAYWTANGLTKDVLIDSYRESAALQGVYDYAVQNVTVTDEDVQAAYEAKIAANQADYADDRTYNSDRSAGVTIAWNPEGYRAVKHVLIMFDENQAALYADLQSQLDSLNAEREAILNPPEDGSDAPTRSIEEVDTDIAACASEIEALYAQLMPKAEEVIAAFNDGTSFDELIATYNEDPGMQNEPTASQGYAVCAGSTYWEQAFTDGAMSIDKIGEISEPVYGSNGIHIIYYMADIEPGAVPLEDIRDSIEADAHDQKFTSVYDAQVDDWMKEANVEYFYENFGVAVAPAGAAEEVEELEEVIEETADEAVEAEAEAELESVTDTDLRAQAGALVDQFNSAAAPEEKTSNTLAGEATRAIATFHGETNGHANVEDFIGQVVAGLEDKSQSAALAGELEDLASSELTGRANALTAGMTNKAMSLPTSGASVESLIDQVVKADGMDAFADDLAKFTSGNLADEAAALTAGIGEKSMLGEAGGASLESLIDQIAAANDGKAIGDSSLDGLADLAAGISDGGAGKAAADSLIAQVAGAANAEERKGAEILFEGASAQ